MYKRQLLTRRASDALTACQGSRADVEYVRLLQLAARTSECEVETVPVSYTHLDVYKRQDRDWSIPRST